MKIASIIIKLIILWGLGMYLISYCFKEDKIKGILTGALLGFIVCSIIIGIIELGKQKKEYVFLKEDYGDEEDESDY